MREPDYYMLAGLGNPGEEYRATRHNIGFMVIDHIADRFSLAIDRTKYDVNYGKGEISGKQVIAAKPLSFMNNSGPPLRRLAQYFRISCKKMLVVHDDIDLAYGRIKIKTKGGHGGHKGVKSIIDAFETDEFIRVRVGIDHPGSKEEVVDHVLSGFTDDERQQLDRLISRAGETVAQILQNGIEKAIGMIHGLS
ncbi:MAG: aminoacyl-tRNA hydrolase [Desulfococcus sp. 4484_241]|nr:MAG: aminoacyl-tRNA hydrolase [Desulfococcus sp. 4484_241]